MNNVTLKLGETCKVCGDKAGPGCVSTGCPYPFDEDEWFPKSRAARWGEAHGRWFGRWFGWLMPIYWREFWKAFR